MRPGPLRAILIGAGNRGADAYGPYAVQHPSQLRFVAVAEPDPERRARFAAQHQIPTERRFRSWEPLLDRPPLGEAALICTQDWLHLEPALAAMRAGYHVLLEKPMATTAEGCTALVQASEETDRQLHICHVLRYTRHFQKMREIVQSGTLGQIITVDHRENVSFWHMAHSFVRGNWRASESSSPMILAKCCHDFDILLWVLDRGCRALSSFGTLTHFRPENAPEGAPAFCLDGCPAAGECPYYAPWIYVDLLPLWRNVSNQASGWPRLVAHAQQRASGLVKALAHLLPDLRQASEHRGWPRSVVAHDPTPENLLMALQDGPYGRCVYHCDNDVVDHQVVAMQFEKSLTVTLTMHGHSHLEGRTTRIQGSRAELQAAFGLGGAWITVSEHRTGRCTRHDTSASPRSGHGGGDAALVQAFVRSLQDPQAVALTSARASLESHLLAFAAERARQEGRVITPEVFRDQLRSGHESAPFTHRSSRG
jgi:predicted dehydrogenase